MWAPHWVRSTRVARIWLNHRTSVHTIEAA